METFPVKTHQWSEVVFLATGNDDIHLFLHENPNINPDTHSTSNLQASKARLGSTKRTDFKKRAVKCGRESL